MIQNISSIGPIIAPNVFHLRPGSGKISVPIKPSQSLNARFKHITALPVNTAEGSVPIYKLQMLDNLIERLIGQKGKAEEFVTISRENIDTLVSHLKDELSFRNSTFKAFQSNLRPGTGLLFNILA
ncbi:MAG: hypothetical protein JXJ04_03415 [Spirochaetales bacterium]|nr:hypothetical protein [Spirochaetales bacterium]